MFVQMKTESLKAYLAKLKNQVRQTFEEADLKSEDCLEISSLAFLLMVLLL
jgi:hypothetical protein